MPSSSSDTHNLPEIPQSRWEPELKAAAKRIHLLTLKFAMVVFLLAAIFDYWNFPEVWLDVFYGRITVVVATIACIFLNRQKIMDEYWLITVPFTLMGVLSSSIYAVAEADFVLTFNCIVFALSIVFGLFAIAKVQHVAFVVGLVLAAIFFFVSQSSHYTLLDWGYHGGFLPIISAALAFLLVYVRVGLQMKEITSRLALQDSQAMLHERNQSLEEAKQELEKANEHLEEVVARRTASLQKSNSERDEMVYRLSHDFKTPMINIRSMMEMVKREQDPDRAAKIFQLIDGSILRFEALVKSMDQFVAYTQEELDLKPVNLKEVIQATWAQLQEKHPTHMEMVLEGTSSHIIYSDEQKLSLVLECLMRNAIQFQSPDGQSTLTITQQSMKDFVLIRMQDNGPGIPQDILDRVCDLFFRGDGRSQGLGLGLYLAKGTMDQLKGTFSITSDAKGTVIDLQVPYAAPIS